jgi:hypothetical protein
VLLLPDRYAQAGQMTQRLVEAVLTGCLPLTPATISAAERFTPQRLHVTTGSDVTTTLTDLQAIAGTGEHAALIAECLRALDIFRLSRQVDVLDDLLTTPHARVGAPP